MLFLFLEGVKFVMFKGVLLGGVVCGGGVIGWLNDLNPYFMA